MSKLNKLSLKTPHEYLILMKLTIPAIGVLSTIVILVSVGVMYGYSYESQMSSQSSVPIGAAYMTGNVKVTHFDENGQVIGYRQGTNHITATGMAVIMGQVFTGLNETMQDSYPPFNPARGTNMSGTVGWMEIGTGGDTQLVPGPPWASDRSYTNALRWNDTDIIEPVLATNPACIRVNADITNTTQAEAHTSPNDCQFGGGSTPQGAVDCAAQMNVTAIAQFQGNDCGVLDIDEAGIFTHQDGSEGLMFARNIFGSVDLNPGDTLQLEWEFTFKDQIG